jgi:uncharacterized membrane protein YeaQ/YmgE (transglycosylase-associated protein family)
MSFVIEYAGMSAVDLGIWVLLASIAGAVARQIVQGKPLLGLWGDMVIGLIGAFAVGMGLREFDFDLSEVILNARPGIAPIVAIYVDVFVSALIGALALRILLRLLKQ